LGVTEEINEDKIGKKGWLKIYWEKLNIFLLPTDLVIKENQKILLEHTSQPIGEKMLLEQIHQTSTQEVGIHSEESPLFE
jgi:hypothetical protein